MNLLGVNDIVQVYRLFTIAELAVVFGMTAMILWVYTPLAVKKQSAKVLNIALISVSYCLLCLYERSSDLPCGRSDSSWRSSSWWRCSRSSASAIRVCGRATSGRPRRCAAR
jgi:hypothetical protein